MVLVVVGFLIGVWLGSDGKVGTQALGLLAAMGAPQYAMYQEIYATREGLDGQKETDYLLFFERDHQSLSEFYFSKHPQVRVVNDTVFNNAVVVALPEPVSLWVEDLKRQSFVWMLLRDRPLFFCH